MNYAFDFGDGNTLNTSSPTVSHTMQHRASMWELCHYERMRKQRYVYPVDQCERSRGALDHTFLFSNPTCDNGTDGHASVTVSSGQAPYQYLWNDANAPNHGIATDFPAGYTCDRYR